MEQVVINNEKRRNKVNLESLPTPCVLIDLKIVEQNLERMAQIAKESGVALRPHTKTHKIPYLASRQIEKGAAGITVAKISEAEVMAAHGIKDIYARRCRVRSRARAVLDAGRHYRNGDRRNRQPDKSCCCFKFTGKWGALACLSMPQ